MAKTQEELKTLKTEYETLNNKLKELSDDELKTVVGGGTDYWLGMEALTEGFWYITSIYPDHILKVITPSEVRQVGNGPYHTGVLFAKYWYDGINAWGHGTCTSVGMEQYCLKDAPANIFEGIYTEKPF